MASISLLALRTKVRERANMENSTFVSDAELTRYINYSIKELFDILVSKNGNEYYAESSQFTLVNGTEAYSLPVDFYKVLWAELKGDDGYWYKMRRFEQQEKNYGRSPVNYFIPDIRYRLRKDKIVFTPDNLIGGRVIRLWYVPQQADLVADGDTFDGINGFDEYIVVRSAIKCLVKEEQDVSALMAELDFIRQRIETMGENRDQGAPSRVYDSQQDYYGDSVWR
jgi:hypothetical protein